MRFRRERLVAVSLAAGLALGLAGCASQPCRCQARSYGPYPLGFPYDYPYGYPDGLAWGPEWWHHWR